jgi:hypothetical protein
MSGLWSHLRQAKRQLLAAPVFSLFSIITLALSIGAVTAVFSFMRVITGAPPGVPEGLGLIARAGMQPLFLRIMPDVDLTLMLLIPALFIAAGIGACALPASRASRANPNVVLRNQ